MPIFEIEAGGKTFEVDAPDMDSAARAINTSPPQGFMGHAADFVKSIPRGIFNSATSAPNTSTMFAVSPMEAELERTAPERMRAIEAAKKSMYAPQGRAGRFGEAVGEGLGNPASYLGPGTLGLKLGGSVLSSLGGEAGGQLAEDTKFEAPAKIIGSLAGGTAAVKAFAPSASKAAVPTYRELKDAATADYNAARNSGLELRPQGVASFASKVGQDLSGPNYGFTGGQFGDAPKTFSVLDTLQKPPVGSTVTASNIDAIRKNLGRLSRETVEGKPTPDAAAASVALQRLNEYAENIPQNHILAGDPSEYVRATKQGNANYSAAQRVRNFDVRLTKAENATDRQVAGSLDSQIKTKVGSMLDNPQKMRGLTQAEKDQIQLINSGSLVSNTLRQLGRGGAGVVPAGFHAVIGAPMAAATGGASMVPQALLAAGLYGARKGAEKMTVSRANKLADMLAKRSPLYESRVNALPLPDLGPNRAAIVRALLAH